MVAKWGPTAMIVMFAILPSVGLMVWTVYYLFKGREQEKAKTSFNYPESEGDHSHYEKSLFYAKERRK